MEVKKKFPKNKLKDRNKAKSLNKKQESKLPKFVMTKFSDQQMQEFIQNYHERRYLNTMEDKSSIFGSTMYSHHKHC
jgi:exonuclease I